MIEITAEIRAFIDKAAAGAELADDELPHHSEPPDGDVFRGQGRLYRQL